MKLKNLLLILALSMFVILGGCTKPVDNHDDDHDHDHGHEEEHSHGEEGHAHGEYEWIGEFELKAGKYLFHFGASPDETMDVGFIKMGDNVTDLDHHASHLMVTEKETIKQDSEFEAKPDYAYTFEMNEDHGHINFTIAEDGTYAIVTEHFPSESSMEIFDENQVEILPIRQHEGQGHSH